MADLQTVVYKLQADIGDIKAAFATVQVQIQKTNTSVTGMAATHQAALTKTGGHVETLGKKYEELAESLHSKVHPALAAVEAGLVGLGLEASLREVANLSDEWNNLKSQLLLTGTATDQVGVVMKSLYGIAQQTGQSFQGLGEMYGRVQRSTREMGLSQTQLLALTKNLSIAVAASGVSAGTAQMGMYQLAQAFSIGKLAGQDMRSVVEELPGVLDLVNKYCEKLGISFQTLKNSTGISATFIAAALVNMGDEVEKISAKIPDSFDKAFTRAKNNLFLLVGQMTDQGMFKPAVEAMNQLAQVFESSAFQQGVANVTTDIVRLVSFMSANIGSVERFTAAVAGAWLGAKVGGAGGAALGSVVPGIGTAFGGGVGALLGAATGAAGGLYATSGHADSGADTLQQMQVLKNRMDELQTARKNLQQGLAQNPTLPHGDDTLRTIEDQLTIVTQQYDKLKEAIKDAGSQANVSNKSIAEGLVGAGAKLDNETILKNLNIGDVAEMNKKLADSIASAQMEAARNANLAAAAGGDPLAFRRAQSMSSAAAQMDRFKEPITLGMPGSAAKLGLKLSDDVLRDAGDPNKPDAVRAANDALRARMAGLAQKNAMAQFNTGNAQQAGSFRETILDEGHETSELAKVTNLGAEAYDHAKVMLDAYLQVKRQHLAMSSSEQTALAKTIAATQEQTRVTEEVVAARRKFEQQQRQVANDNGAIGLNAKFQAVNLTGGKFGDSSGAVTVRPEDLALMKQRQTYMDSFLESIQHVTDPKTREGLLENAKAWERTDEAQRQAADSAKLVATQQQTIAEDGRLVTAMQQRGLAGYNQEKTLIAAENQVLATYHTLQSQDAQDALKRALAHGQTAAALEKESSLINSASEPFKQAIDNVQTDFADFFDTILSNGEGAWKNLGQSFEDTMRKSVSNFLAAGLMDPQKFMGLVQGIQSAMKSPGVNPDGTPMTGFEKTAQGIQFGGMGAAVGSTAGGFITSATGGNQQMAGIGSAVGGIGGGILGGVITGGNPIGVMIGAAIGSAVGGIAGGLFGGGGMGKNNDAQGYTYDASTGEIKKTDKKGSTQNANAARQLIDQGKSSVETLSTYGLAYGGSGLNFKVGNASGIQFNGTTYASSEEALQAAIKSIIADTTGNVSATIKTILANTKASSAQTLQQDLAFAHTYEQLQNNGDQFLDSLYNLRMQFEQAKVQATNLGLSVTGLADSENKAIQKLKDDSLRNLTNQTEQAADQIRSFLSNIITPYKSALTNIHSTVDSPKSTIDSLLTQFRSTYKNAANDDQTALANLPQLGQQLIQLAQQFGASGEFFTKIYQEVTRDLSSVMKTQTDRQTEILASIPDTIKFTSAEQLEVLKTGFNDMVEKLEQLRTDLRNAA
jgi:tape measure domain-containing protein